MNLNKKSEKLPNRDAEFVLFVKLNTTATDKVKIHTLILY